MFCEIALSSCCICGFFGSAFSSCASNSSRRRLRHPGEFLRLGKLLVELLLDAVFLLRLAQRQPRFLRLPLLHRLVVLGHLFQRLGQLLLLLRGLSQRLFLQRRLVALRAPASGLPPRVTGGSLSIASASSASRARSRPSSLQNVLLVCIRAERVLQRFDLFVQPLLLGERLARVGLGFFRAAFRSPAAPDSSSVPCSSSVFFASCFIVSASVGASLASSLRASVHRLAEKVERLLRDRPPAVRASSRALTGARAAIEALVHLALQRLREGLARRLAQNLLRLLRERAPLHRSSTPGRVHPGSARSRSPIHAQSRGFAVRDLGL